MTPVPDPDLTPILTVEFVDKALQAPGLVGDEPEGDGGSPTSLIVTAAAPSEHAPAEHGEPSTTEPQEPPPADAAHASAPYSVPVHDPSLRPMAR